MDKAALSAGPIFSSEIEAMFHVILLEGFIFLLGMHLSLRSMASPCLVAEPSVAP